MKNIYVVVPNWNGIEHLPACLDSLLAQSSQAKIVVVDNGSGDGSLGLLQTKYPGINVLVLPKNRGFAGGVNHGIRYAIGQSAEYIALFNNDAVADKDWLEQLVAFLDNHSGVGVVTGKLLSAHGTTFDSTGDLYTNWGLPFPRGRGESVSRKYDSKAEIFAATGGASLYRVSMLQEIGLFDEDFFAYYEDVDLSFRAQLAGWKVRYEPKALATHRTGSTSSRIKGFTTYQTMKNLPWLVIKNVPRPYLWHVAWRLRLAHASFFFSAVARGQGWAALKGLVMSWWLTPKKILERRRIQRARKVSPDYIWSIMTHDLPPNATKLRSLRTKWWHLTGKAKS